MLDNCRILNWLSVLDLYLGQDTVTAVYTADTTESDDLLTPTPGQATVAVIPLNRVETM